MVRDLASGKTRALIDEVRLAGLLSGALGKPIKAPIGIEEADYTSADGRLTFGAGGKRWTLSADATTLGDVGKRQPDDTSAVSPDGRFEIVARTWNLIARERSTGREIALTTDGTREPALWSRHPRTRDDPETGDPRIRSCRSRSNGRPMAGGSRRIGSIRAASTR